MQLKRDTDYALRILFCLTKQYGGKKEKLTIQELCQNTRIPKTIVFRLCCKLEEANLLKTTDTAEGYTSYSIESETLNKTVWDVIQATEGNCNIFAIFDRSTELFCHCKDSFEDTNRLLTEALKCMTLKEFQKN